MNISNLLRPLSALVIALLVLWAYAPALDHVPKDDQMTYLAGVAHKRDLASLTVGSYAFNRDKGTDSVLLFRPGLYFLLGAEQYFFGYRFALWQAFGILLHLLVCWALGRLLWAIRPGSHVFLLVALFAFMPAHAAMVNWTNIHGYMLFALLLLTGLRRLYERTNDARSVIKLAFLMLAACLLYELGIVFSVLLAVYLWLTLQPEKKRLALWMLLGPAVLVTWNVWDFLFIHPVVSRQTGYTLSQVLSIDTLVNFGRILKWMLTGGIFLSSADMLEVNRTIVFPRVFDWAWPFSGFSQFVVRGSLLTILGLVLLRLGWNRELIKARGRFIGLLAAMLLVYVGMIVTGRANSRGIDWLTQTPYYLYIFWALALVMFSALIDLEAIKRAVNFRSLGVLAAAVMVITAGANAASVRQVNQMTARSHAASRELLGAVAGFIDQHKAEPDFSFYVENLCAGNRPEYLGTETDCNYAAFYWPEYFRRNEPKYELKCKAVVGS